MIKFIHLADIHLGMENYGKIDKKTGLHSRMADFLRSFDFVVDYAIKNKIDFVLFAGDAFKTRDPSPTYVREFAKRIKKLAGLGVKVVLLVGNHDLPNAIGKANTLDIYSALEVENVYVARKPEVLRFAKINGQWQPSPNLDKPSMINQFQIAALPWIPKTQLLSAKEYERKEISESYKLMSEKLKEKVEKLANEVDKNFLSVFLGHLSVAGATFGSEQKAYIGSDVVLSQDVLQSGPWRYAALGHLHRHQVLSQNPPIVYSGSLERVDFGEGKEDKGFILCELDTNKKANACEYKFIPVPARRFLSIFFKLNDGEANPTEKILKQIEKFKAKDAVVKVNLEIPEEKLKDLDEKAISEKFFDAFYFVGIQKEILRKERRQSFENIESLSVQEILEKYWQSKNISAKRIGELKQYAQKLLEE